MNRILEQEAKLSDKSQHSQVHTDHETHNVSCGHLLVVVVGYESGSVAPTDKIDGNEVKSPQTRVCKLI